MELKINPELQSFIPQMSEKEYRLLEDDIVANGCRDPLVVWDGTIIDGHHRYEICRKHDIPFNVVEERFSSIGEAELWMMKNQLCRRSVGKLAKVVMALKCKPYLMELGKQNQGCRSDLNIFLKSRKSHNTNQMLSEIAGVSEDYIRRVEKIWETVDDETKAELLQNEKLVNKTYNMLFPKVKKLPSQAAMDVPVAQEAAGDPMVQAEPVVQNTPEGEGKTTDHMAALRAAANAFMEELNDAINYYSRHDCTSEQQEDLSGIITEVSRSLSDNSNELAFKVQVTDDEDAEIAYENAKDLLLAAVSCYVDNVEHALWYCDEEVLTLERVKELIGKLDEANEQNKRVIINRSGKDAPASVNHDETIQKIPFERDKRNPLPYETVHRHFENTLGDMKRQVKMGLNWLDNQDLDKVDELKEMVQKTCKEVIGNILYLKDSQPVA